MKLWKRLGNYMPMLATVAVVGCVGTALKGYAAPVYEVEQPETTQSTEADVKEKKQETEETEQAKKGNFDLADGFYKGSGTGFAGTVSVSVEIKDKSIVAINILSTQDDEAFFGSIIFFVGLTLPRYRFSKPYASLDMNLRQCVG